MKNLEISEKFQEDLKKYFLPDRYSTSFQKLTPVVLVSGEFIEDFNIRVYDLNLISGSPEPENIPPFELSLKLYDHNKLLFKYECFQREKENI